MIIVDTRYSQRHVGRFEQRTYDKRINRKMNPRRVDVFSIGGLYR
jgi:hypothetical protein